MKLSTNLQSLDYISNSNHLYNVYLKKERDRGIERKIYAWNVSRRFRRAPLKGTLPCTFAKACSSALHALAYEYCKTLHAGPRFARFYHCWIAFSDGLVSRT